MSVLQKENLKLVLVSPMVVARSKHYLASFNTEEAGLVRPVWSEVEVGNWTGVVGTEKKKPESLLKLCLKRRQQCSLKQSISNTRSKIDGLLAMCWLEC